MIKEQLDRAETNSALNGEYIRSVKPTIIDDVKDYFYYEISKRYLLNLSKEIDIIHRRLGGIKQLPMDIKEEIAQRIINDDEQPLGFKYTLQHKAQAIFEVLKKYVR